MTRIPYYRYLGTNGIIESPVHLEDIYFVKLAKLTADKGKVLINANKERKYTVTVPEDEVNLWKEIAE